MERYSPSVLLSAGEVGDWAFSPRFNVIYLVLRVGDEGREVAVLNITTNPVPLATAPGGAHERRFRWNGSRTKPTLRPVINIPHRWVGFLTDGVLLEAPGAIQV